MTDIVGLDHVQVAAPPGCEDAARAFYGGLLGLLEIDKPPLLAVRGGCWFRVGAGELHVGAEDPFRPALKAHPALLVGSGGALEELAESLAGSGVEIRWADDEGLVHQPRPPTTLAEPAGSLRECLVSS